MKFVARGAALLVLSLCALPACENEKGKNLVPEPEPDTTPTLEEPLFERPPGPAHDGVYSFVNGCYRIEAAPAGASSNEVKSQEAAFLVAQGDGFAFAAAEEGAGAAFFMKASDLGTYLFYDEEEHFFVIEEQVFLRKDELLSDIFTLDDSYLPGAQWELQLSEQDETRFQLRHLRSGHYLTMTGLAEQAIDGAVITLYPAEGCAVFPELSLDAEGTVVPRQFDDGSVYGIVDTHSHIMSNFGFGGAGIFHGAPFHPLGVKHALPSCEMFHGVEGRKDLFGFGNDRADEFDEETMLTAFLLGRTPEFNHHTDGYPTFTDWPSAVDSSTHQTQYYRWIERAYLGGLRLIVNHATTNQVICELISGTGAQPIRYSCNDMVAADRIIEESRRMERYIDAQSGGPGKGWFRIVETPAQAREVINEGKLAVILGLEVSALFDCFLVPPGGGERCTEAQVVEALDAYYAKGIRALFPVHKFDNAFSAGDGHRDIIELGNFAHTGHWSNFTEDCPDVPTVFDRGNVSFGELNQPREDYFSDPPNDMSGFADNPNRTLLGHVNVLRGGGLSGDYCQNAGMTALGEFLMMELMKRGMIIEVDHFPRRAYQRAFELLEANDYPAAGTHGNHNRTALYALGGVSRSGISRCGDPERPGTMIQHRRGRIELIESVGGFPAEGFGFDLNGFGGAPRPRFGEKSRCAIPQENPITYPFESLDGDVTFSEPRVGQRTIDFNTEGLAHIGLLPELLEDARRDGATEEDFEHLLKSAEGYLRMWEKAERRAEALRGE